MDRVRRQLGITEDGRLVRYGEPVVVAVLDSGISQHPDLKDALFAFYDFSGSAGKGGKRVFYQTPYDEYGHGTHVCGIIAGSGIASGGKYQGICPGVRLVVGKVLDEHGDGCVEDMISGLEWILSTQSKFGTRLLNLSIGVADLRQKEKEERLRQMLQRISEAGILVLCAAGNKGPAPGSLSFLGEGSKVLSIGCHDGAYFSNDPGRCENHSGRGTLRGLLRKPDLVAPGTRIRSCSSKYRPGMLPSLAYEMRSGTSMATPIVTGCAARVLCMAPKMSAKELRHLMTMTATDLHLPWNQQGFGMINWRKMRKIVEMAGDS